MHTARESSKIPFTTTLEGLAHKPPRIFASFILAQGPSEAEHAPLGVIPTGGVSWDDQAAGGQRRGRGQCWGGSEHCRGVVLVLRLGPERQV